eukprot:gb/GECG01008558.1/.p1 GENE.gb/GECG01008558.1/~~gb/GECG01008558.1/.p1  ORF type:complete len:1402 (+),score=208.38 gb/GECG01008558.1/:1-4206(+)
MVEPPAAYLRSSKVLYELEPGEITIGRGAQNDIVLTESKSISNKHARLIVRPGSKKRAKLIDVGSTNGTFVNQTLLKNTTAELNSGDIIRFGFDAVQYRFDFHEVTDTRGITGQGETPEHGHGKSPSKQYADLHTTNATYRSDAASGAGSLGVHSQRIQSPTHAERQKRESDGPYSQNNASGGPIGHNDSAETILESEDRAAGISTRERTARHSASGEPPKLKRDPAHPGQNGSAMNDILYGGGYGQNDDRFSSSARSATEWHATGTSSPLTATNVRTSGESYPEQATSHPPSHRSPDLQRSADKSARETLAQSLRESHHKAYKDTRSPQRATTGTTSAAQSTTYGAVRHSANARANSTRNHMADTSAERGRSKSQETFPDRSSQRGAHTRANSSPPGCADLSKRREERKRAQEQLRAMVRRDRASQRKARLRAASAASRSAMEAASNTMKELYESVERGGNNNIPPISVVYPAGPNPYASGDQQHNVEPHDTAQPIHTPVQTRPVDAANLNMTKDSLQSEFNDKGSQRQVHSLDGPRKSDTYEQMQKAISHSQVNDTGSQGQAHFVDNQRQSVSFEQRPNIETDRNQGCDEVATEAERDRVQSQAVPVSEEVATSYPHIQWDDVGREQRGGREESNQATPEEEVGRAAASSLHGHAVGGNPHRDTTKENRLRESRESETWKQGIADKNGKRNSSRGVPTASKASERKLEQRDRSNSSPSRESSGESEAARSASPVRRSHSWSGRKGRVGTTGGDGIVIQSFNGNLILGEDARKRLSETSQPTAPTQTSVSTMTDHVSRHSQQTPPTETSALPQRMNRDIQQTVASGTPVQQVSEASPINIYSTGQTSRARHTNVSEVITQVTQRTLPSNHVATTAATHVPESGSTTDVGPYQQPEVNGRLKDENERMKVALASSESRISKLEEDRDALQEKLDSKTAELKNSLERERSHGQDVTELMQKISSLRSVGIATSQKAGFLLLDSVCRKSISRKATRMFYRWRLAVSQGHLQKLREEIRTLRADVAQKEEERQQELRHDRELADQYVLPESPRTPEVSSKQCEADVPSREDSGEENALYDSRGSEEPARPSNRDAQLEKLIELLSKFFADESPRDSVEELSSAISSTKSSHKSEKRKAAPTVDKIAEHLYKAQELANSAESDNEQTSSASSSSDSESASKPRQKANVSRKAQKKKKSERTRRRRNRRERRSSSTSSDGDASKLSAPAEGVSNENQRNAKHDGNTAVDNNATMDPTVAEHTPNQPPSAPTDSYGLALGRELQRQFEHKQQAMMFASPNAPPAYSTMAPPPNVRGMYSTLPPINSSGAPSAPPQYPSKQPYYPHPGNPYGPTIRGPAYYGPSQPPPQPPYQQQHGAGIGPYNQSYHRPVWPPPPQGTAPQYAGYKW